MPHNPTVIETANSTVRARNRIQDFVRKTPCLPSKANRPDGAQLFFKMENLQRTGSFKVRGAFSKLRSLPTDVPVITASSGNHGIACSLAAQTTGHALTVVLPENVARKKLAEIESFGTKVLLHPGDSGLAERHARALAEDEGYVYVSPYNDPEVVAGQGTIGLEILEQVPDPQTVFISLGGGGLVAGIGSALKCFGPDVRVIGVAAENSAALAKSLTAGKIIDTEHHDTLADGCAGGMDHDALTFPIAQQVIDDVLIIPEAEIAAAMRDLAWGDGMIVEGAAALALAGFMRKEQNLAGQNSVVLLCGANVDRTTMETVLRDDV